MSIYELENLACGLSRLAGLVRSNRLSCDIDSLIDDAEAYIKQLKRQIERLEAEHNGQYDNDQGGK